MRVSGHLGTFLPLRDAAKPLKATAPGVPGLDDCRSLAEPPVTRAINSGAQLGYRRLGHVSALPAGQDSNISETIAELPPESPTAGMTPQSRLATANEVALAFCHTWRLRAKAQRALDPLNCLASPYAWYRDKPAPWHRRLRSLPPMQT